MWGVPIDHEYFENTSVVQWLWYHYQDTKDQEEQYIRNRNLVEYHANFIEPELVSEIMKKRDEGKLVNTKVNKEDDAIFSESLRQMFGRSPAPMDEQFESGDKISGALERIARFEYDKTQTHTPGYNYRHWLDVDLE